MRQPRCWHRRKPSAEFGQYVRLDDVELTGGQSVAMLAHHGSGCLIAQTGRLHGCETMRDGKHEGASKHVACAIGVNGFDFFGWNVPSILGR